MSVPQRKGTRYFYARNPGLLDQAVLHVREGRDGAERVLLDPNTLTADGTAALTAAEPSADGALLAYARLAQRQRLAGALRARRRDRTGPPRPGPLGEVHDRSRWTKDASAFFYIRFPAPGSVPAGDENYCARVYRHRLGEPQEEDALVCESPDREVVFQTDITDDGRVLVIQSFKGSSDKGEVHLLDLEDPSAPSGSAAVHGRLHRRVPVRGRRGRAPLLPHHRRQERRSAA